jgi:tetratricopeptide (TPR) repeat protein
MESSDSTRSLAFASLFERGRVLFSLRRHEDAAVYFQSAAFHPDGPGFSWSMLALCYLNMSGADARSLWAAEKGVKAQPDECLSLATLAYVMSRSSSMSWPPTANRAKKLAQQALERSPGDAFALAVLAQIFLLLRNFSKAESAARSALATDPDEPLALLVLVDVLAGAGRQKELAGLVESRLTHRADDSLSHLMAGWSQLHSKEPHLADTHFLEALRLNPEDALAKLGLAEARQSRWWPHRITVRIRNELNRRFGRYWMILVALGMLSIVVLGEDTWGQRHSLLYRTLQMMIVLGAIWIWLGGVVSTMRLLWDPFVRHQFPAWARPVFLQAAGCVMAALVLWACSFQWEPEACYVAVVLFSISAFLLVNLFSDSLTINYRWPRLFATLSWVSSGLFSVLIFLGRAETVTAYMLVGVGFTSMFSGMYGVFLRRTIA